MSLCLNITVKTALFSQMHCEACDKIAYLKMTGNQSGFLSVIPDLPRMFCSDRLEHGDLDLTLIHKVFKCANLRGFCTVLGQAIYEGHSILAYRTKTMLIRLRLFCHSLRSFIFSNSAHFFLFKEIS